MEDYPIRNNRKSGRQSICKTCHRDDMRARKSKNRKVRNYKKRKTGLYVWRDHSDTIRYVGITAQELSARNTAHRNNDDAVWTDYAIEPTKFESVYPNFDLALAAEEAYIKALVEAGTDLVNRTHNKRNSPEHYINTVSTMRRNQKKAS